MWDKVNQRIGQALQGIRQAFRVVTGTTNSGTKVSLLQARGLAGEAVDSVEYFQHYGLTSSPPAGSMGIALPLNGATSHTVIIATEHGTYRLKSLNPGEVALYTDEGASVVLKRGKIIEATCDEYRVNCKKYSVNAADSADFSTPRVTATQEVIATGKITGSGGMAISGSSGGAAATFTGSVQQTGGSYQTTGDVTAGTISLRGHTHSNGNNGSPTGVPMG